MRNSIRIAALLVSGALFIGCDSKDNSTTTPPATPPSTPSMTPPATPSMTPPATPSMTPSETSKMDQLKQDANNMKNDVSKMMPSTMPSMPAMPK